MFSRLGLVTFFALSTLVTFTSKAGFYDGPANELYNLTESKGAKEEDGYLSNTCGSPIEASSCASILAQQQKTALINSNSTTTQNYGFSTSYNQNFNNNRYEATVSYCTRKYQANGTTLISDFCGYQAYVFAQFYSATVYTCPPDSYENWSLPAKVDNTNLCYDPNDISFRDSCPDSVSDGSYILPVTPNNQGSIVCQQKPDGSQCKYNRVDDYYETDFENNCYVDENILEYQSGENNQPDPQGNECQDIGTESFCLEDPDNVCDAQGTCNTGCGSISIGNSSPQFGCFSEDYDNDGVPDYKDPDIDGDGIRNEDDLDSDGDGVDDPYYGGSGSGTSTLILENLTRETNSELSNIKEEIKKQNGSGLMPAYSVSEDELTFNQGIYSKINDSELVTAFDSISGAIVFGSGSACPDLSFYLPSLGETIGTTIHCDIMPTLGAIITPVMLAIYLWLGFRVFASA